ncbi:hypothetical protein RRG08_022993 [Elysia crispata]|uniref:Uncharacterized protein n=1 Tax=Elysia crispata TaxID=231223 RepID=A0AAE1AGN1_9GAST|nr:hypothetical protein RRG08_022993 [Elysia crispata]
MSAIGDFFLFCFSTSPSLISCLTHDLSALTTGPPGDYCARESNPRLTMSAIGDFFLFCFSTSPSPIFCLTHDLSALTTGPPGALENRTRDSPCQRSEISSCSVSPPPPPPSPA